MKTFRKYLFVCKSMGNGPVEGAITSILKHKGREEFNQKRSVELF